MDRIPGETAVTEAGLGQASEERETLKDDQKIGKECRFSNVTPNSFSLFKQQMPPVTADWSYPLSP